MTCWKFLLLLLFCVVVVVVVSWMFTLIAGSNISHKGTAPKRCQETNSNSNLNILFIFTTKTDSQRNAPALPLPLTLSLPEAGTPTRGGWTEGTD